MRIPDTAPDQVRYFFATPFMFLGDIFCYLGLFIMGRNNAMWTMLHNAKEMGAEIMTLDEYEKLRGKKLDEQEDKE